MSIQTEQLNTHSSLMQTHTLTHAHMVESNQTRVPSNGRAEQLLMFSRRGASTLFMTLAAQVCEEQLIRHHLRAPSIIYSMSLSIFMLNICISLDICHFWWQVVFFLSKHIWKCSVTV